MSSFSSLNLGARAIFAAQRGLDITGQNIANSATPGYSRQRVDQVAVGGPTVPAIWSKYDQTGGGVKVTGISRMRDEFLESRARTAHQASGQLNELQGTYEAVERTIGEPSSTGLKQRMVEFWQSWGPAGNNLAQAPRDVVVERGKAVAEQLNLMGGQLETQWADTRTQLEANITDVNKAAADIATLNRAIRNNVINGLPANELADQRDLLVEKVTTLTGGVAERAEDGVVNVKLGDNYLVSGQQAGSLKVEGGASSYAAWDGATRTTVGWATGVGGADTPTGAVLGPNSDLNPNATMNGQLKALNEILPSYLTKLDDVATSLATAVNAQQSEGFTAAGDSGADIFGFIDPANPTVPPTSAAPDRRAAVVLRFTGTQAGLAISSVNRNEPDGGGVKALNGDNAKAMAGHVADLGGPDDKFRAVVVALGVEASSVYRNQQAATNVAKNADDARDSVSGVSLNEEMTNLMQYQHSFEAAAKFITAVDATIESLLNMTR